MSTTEGLSVSKATNYTFETRVPKRGRRTVAIAGATFLLLAACSAGDTDADPSASAQAGGANAAATYEEVVQFDAGAPTFENFNNVSGPGIIYQKGARVIVRCAIANGPANAAESTDGKWYLLGEKQSGVNMYTPANVYENNSDLSLPLSQQNAIDPRVRHCTAEEVAPLELPVGTPQNN